MAHLLRPAAAEAAVVVVAARGRRTLQPAATLRAERLLPLQQPELVAPHLTERPPQQTTLQRLQQRQLLLALVAPVAAARQPEVGAVVGVEVEQPVAVAVAAAGEAATQPRRQRLREPRKALWPRHCKPDKQSAICGVPKALGIHFATPCGCRNRMAANALCS